MTAFLRHEKDIVQILLLGTDSDEAGSSDGVITPWERNHFKKCKCYTFHYNILYYFRNLSTFVEKINFTSK
jgi:hypothetical protein